MRKLIIFVLAFSLASCAFEDDAQYFMDEDGIRRHECRTDFDCSYEAKETCVIFPYGNRCLGYDDRASVVCTVPLSVKDGEIPCPRETRYPDRRAPYDGLTGEPGFCVNPEYWTNLGTCYFIRLESKFNF